MSENICGTGREDQRRIMPAPSGGTNNTVFSKEEPYACLCFDPHDSGACAPYLRELFYAGYNVRSCERYDDDRRDELIAAPGCVMFVAFITKRYVGSGQFKRDWSAAVDAGKPLAALYLTTYEDSVGDDAYKISNNVRYRIGNTGGTIFEARTGEALFSRLEDELLERGCFAGTGGEKPRRRSFEIPDFLYDFTRSGEGLILTRYTGSGRDVVIQESYFGYPVAGIGAHAFENCVCVVSVTVPDSVKSVGRYAFNSCESLVSAVLPGGSIRSRRACSATAAALFR